MLAEKVQAASCSVGWVRRADGTEARIVDGREVATIKPLPNGMYAVHFTGQRLEVNAQRQTLSDAKHLVIGLGVFGAYDAR